MPTLSREYDQHFRSFGGIPYRSPCATDKGKGYKDNEKRSKYLSFEIDNSTSLSCTPLLQLTIILLLFTYFTPYLKGFYGGGGPGQIGSKISRSRSGSAVTRPGGKGQVQGPSAQPIHNGKTKEEEDDDDNEAEVSCVMQNDII